MNGGDCPTCGRTWGDEVTVPPEPPVGTWMRDRFGGVTYHQVPGGWGRPGVMPFARWAPMWEARGPLVECAPYGQDEGVES